MPVKIWSSNKQGLHSAIRTDWEIEFTSEEHRREAEELDHRLDDVLDGALIESKKKPHGHLASEFVRAWAIGNSLRNSGVLSSEFMTRERRQLLWLALSRKCRLGARADGKIEPKWRDLRPATASEPRREGGKLDYFEMCYWLAEQPLDDAIAVFGGQVRNVWQMLERPTLRALALRVSLMKWLEGYPPKERGQITRRRSFATMMKMLRAQWPDRGPGSAKRPLHMSEKSLIEETRRLLSSHVDQVLMSSKEE